jgi:hypothetical protein
MSKRLLLASVAALAVSGCSFVPAPPEAEGILVQDIVNEVQCELASIYSTPYGATAQKWIAKVTMDLKVVNDAFSAPTVTVTPVISTGTLTVPIGPDFHGQSVRTDSLVYNVHMRSLAPRGRPPQKFSDCPFYTGLPEAGPGAGVGVGPGLGLAEWLLSTAATSQSRSDTMFESAAYNMEFVILRGLHGGFTFQHKTVNIAAGANTISHSNDNHLIVAFTIDKEAGPGARHVSEPAHATHNDQTPRFLPQRYIRQNIKGHQAF